MLQNQICLCHVRKPIGIRGVLQILSGGRHLQLCGGRHLKLSGSRNLKVSGCGHLKLSGDRHFKSRKTYICIIYISQDVQYMCIQFLALLCVTTQQRYCRHAGVRRVLFFFFFCAFVSMGPYGRKNFKCHLRRFLTSLYLRNILS